MTARVAHRGDARAARENTLEAVTAALRAGADTVEIDVRRTSDDHVVVLHDPTLERLWGDPRPVASLTWGEVSAAGGERMRIPELDAVLEVMSGTGATLLIDMDAADPAAAAWRVVQESAADVPVAWCGDTEAMRVIRSLDADAEIWMAWYRAEPPRASDLAELRPAVVNLDHLLAGAELVQRVHDLGARVSCWTVDDADQLAWLVSIGVDSVTTNDLGLFERMPDEASERRRARHVAGLLAGFAIDCVRATSEDGPREIRTKANPADHVTELDTGIEKRVREVIGAQFPAHDFVGEEFGGDGGAERPCWYLDPVDGTANLANGVPWTSFSLALVEEGRPVVGVVADPWRGDVVTASAGDGAWRCGRALVLSGGDADASTDRLRGRIVSTELAGHRAWPGLLPLMGALADRYCTVRVMGSGTLTLTGIALGRGVGAVIGTFGPVDHLAAMLIVEEAGGVVLDERGERSLFPSSGGVLAARDDDTARQLFELWRDARES